MWTLLWLLTVAVAPIAGLIVYNASRLRRMPLQELERQVLAIPDDYFAYIGRDIAAVREFCRLIHERDLRALDSAWPRIEKAFLAAERQRGHRGRPLFMDYFFSYRSFLRECLRRVS